MTAVQALGLAGFASLLMVVLEGSNRRGECSSHWTIRSSCSSGCGPSLPGLSPGPLLAAPQWLEFLRILGLSRRGYWGFGGDSVFATSFEPIAALEWFLPLAFGKVDLSFWGIGIYHSETPLFWSLYPGVVVWMFVLASLRLRRGAAIPDTPISGSSERLTADRAASRVQWFSWPAILGGLFFALGAANPVVVWLTRFEALASLRYPIKLWLPIALGGSLLAGLGWARTLGETDQRSASYGIRVLVRIAFALLTVYVAIFLYVNIAGEQVVAWIQSADA